MATDEASDLMVVCHLLMNYLLTITLGNSFQNAFWRELMNFMVTDILMDTRQGHGLGYLHCKAVMWNSPLYAGNMFFITTC